MIERFFEIRQPVGTVLLNHPNGPPMVTAAQVAVLTEIMNVLQPLEALTKEIIPMTQLLELRYEKLTTSNELARLLKVAIARECKNRWSAVEFNYLLSMATLLDPRFKKLHFRNILACPKAVQYVAKAVREFSLEQEEEAAKSRETPSRREFILTCLTSTITILYLI